MRTLCIQTVMLSCMLSSASLSAIALEGKGVGNGALSARVAAAVDDVMRDQKIVGMTVAVTRKGKLLLSRGYGVAKRRGVKVWPMSRSYRTPIGSVSKAVVTGPSLWIAARHKGVAMNRRLYGPSGILRHTSNDEVKIAIDKYESIVGLAIGKDDRVYAWGADGKVRKGWSRDLDRDVKGDPYVIPNGRTPRDIAAIAITKSGKVYTWYRDGASSIGTPNDLGAHRSVQLDSDGDVSITKLPKGQAMRNVIGAAIRKSDDRVYVWYKNGKVSIGSSRNFAKHSAGRTFHAPTRLLRHQIIDLGLAHDNAVYAWYAGGRTSTGTSEDLDSKRKLAKFTPSLSAFRTDTGIYEDITLQNVLDHRAGFERSGDVPGAAWMYDRLSKNLKYKDVHAHFLMANQLKWRPGKYSYSNHGFGLTTLLIETITDRSYRDFTRNSYLKWHGLEKQVLPRSAAQRDIDADIFDAVAEKRNGKRVIVGVKPRAHSDSDLGLAAGGWLASAESLVRITNRLSASYSVQDLDDMGWGSKGSTVRKLSHHGATGGGEAYVAIFTKGYVAAGSLDIGDVHVAVASNTGGLNDRVLQFLADEIAKAVPKSDVPSNANYW